MTVIPWPLLVLFVCVIVFPALGAIFAVAGERVEQAWRRKLKG